MNTQTDPLAALKDIHLPEPVSFWPLATGWWFVIAFGIALSIAAWLYVRRRRRSIRAAALNELQAVRVSYQQNKDSSWLALQLSKLIRRVALMRYPRRDVAALHGEQWLEFVRSTARDPEIATVIAKEMEGAIYAPPSDSPSSGSSDEQAEEWMQAARAWLGAVV